MKDANGIDLKPGDPVLILGTVNAVCGFDVPPEYPNGTVRACIGAFSPSLSLRTDQVVKVGGELPDDWRKTWPAT